MTERGASAAAGSGVTRAIPTAAPARWSAHGPTAASCPRRSRSRTTMKSQRWRFFELPEWRPASRIRSISASPSGSRGESPDRPPRTDGVPGGHASRDDRPTIARAGEDARSPTRGASGSGNRRASAAAAASPAAVGRERPAEGTGEEGRHPSAEVGILVQPAVPALVADEELHRSGSHGRPSRVEGGPGDPPGVGDRHDRIRPAVGDQEGTLVADHRMPGADLPEEVATRPEVDPGRQPGERLGDRPGDGQPGEAECLADHRPRIGRRGHAHDGGDPWIGGRGQDRPDPAHRVTRGSPRSSPRAGRAGRRSRPRHRLRTRRR